MMDLNRLLPPPFVRLVILLFPFGISSGYAQVDTVLLEESASLQFPFLTYQSSFACRLDRQNPDYAYSANMHFGLGIYNLSTPGMILPVLDLPIDSFNGLDISTIQQVENLLFVGIGDFQTKDNPATGLAILDISLPAQPQLVGIWDSTAFTKGVSHLQVQDGLVYLSIMADGLLILDVSDPEHIQFVSHFLPDITYPAPSTEDHQSRGLKIRNDSLFLAFDRGGLRIIDVSDPYFPEEIGKYINLDLNSTAGAAYNDVVITDHYAICSVDYCGLEVIDLSTTPMTSASWYNPWGCGWLNWSGASLHLNELQLTHQDSLLLVSAGLSEVLAFDVTDPAKPVPIGQFGSPANMKATYGLDVVDDRVLTSYINTPYHFPPFTPLFSNFGGLKLLEIDAVLSAVHSVDHAMDIHFFPNPCNGSIQIETESEIDLLTVYDPMGRVVCESGPYPAGRHRIDISALSPGFGVLQIRNDHAVRMFKVIRQ